MGQALQQAPGTTHGGNPALAAAGTAEIAQYLTYPLDVMVPSIKETSDLVREIAAASREQSQGVGQINGAMGQLNKAAQLQEPMAFLKIEEAELRRAAHPHVAFEGNRG